MALTKVPGVMLIGQGLANIQDYGAHSVTEPGYTAFDSTAAIQQAINSGNPVYVPPGVYEISATLTLPQDATILGSVNVNPVDPGAQTVPLRIPTFAKYTSVIQYKSGLHGAIFSPNAGLQSNIYIYGICLRFQDVATTDYGISFAVVAANSVVTFDSCYMENIRGAVMNVPSATGYELHVTNCYMNRCFLTSPDQNYSLMRVTNSKFYSCLTCYQPLLKNLHYENNYHEVCQGTLRLLNLQNADSVHIVGNTFISETIAPVYLSLGSGESCITIVGNTFIDSATIQPPTQGNQSHICIQGGVGSTIPITVTGNTFKRKRTGATNVGTPYLLELLSVQPNIKWSGNNDTTGWSTAPISVAATGAGRVVADSFTIPSDIGNPNTSTDILSTILRLLSLIVASPTRVYIKEAHKLILSSDAPKIILDGTGSVSGVTTVTLVSSVTPVPFIGGLDGIIWSVEGATSDPTVQYDMRGGLQYIPRDPEANARFNNFPVRSILWLGVTDAAVAGYIKTANPNTWGQIRYVA